MNGLATNSSIPQNRLAGGANRSDLLDSKISYLKILALSLLREIASVEKMEDGQGRDSIDLHAEVGRFERELIRSALIQTGGRQRPAARLLGTKVTTLNTKIKRYKIKIPDETNGTTDLQIIHAAD
jgi:transcriptional regulator with GAF, ATPase, and Fis domain